MAGLAIPQQFPVLFLTPLCHLMLPSCRFRFLQFRTRIPGSIEPSFNCWLCLSFAFFCQGKHDVRVLTQGSTYLRPYSPRPHQLRHSPADFHSYCGVPQISAGVYHQPGLVRINPFGNYSGVSKLPVGAPGIRGQTGSGIAGSHLHRIGSNTA